MTMNNHLVKNIFEAMFFSVFRKLSFGLVCTSEMRPEQSEPEIQQTGTCFPMNWHRLRWSPQAKPAPNQPKHALRKPSCHCHRQYRARIHFPPNIPQKRIFFSTWTIRGDASTPRRRWQTYVTHCERSHGSWNELKETEKRHNTIDKIECNSIVWLPFKIIIVLLE